MGRLAVFGAALLVEVLVFVPSSAARADDGKVASDDAARAEALFQEGRAAMTEKRFTVACARFEESNKIDPSAGTLLNWGRCLEELGKTASAFEHYRDADRLAKERGQQRHVDAARVLLDALGPRLTKLTIVAVETPGLRIVRDGAEVEIGKAVAIDPGKHVVEATAVGYEPFSKTIDVPAGSSGVELTVPALVRSAGVASPDVPVVITPPPPEDGGRWKTGPLAAGIAISAVGVGGVVLGTAFGVSVLQSSSEAESNPRLCPKKQCSPSGLAYLATTENLATASTVALIAGGVLAVGGIPLIVLAAPDDDRTSLAIGPLAGATGISLSGGF